MQFTTLLSVLEKRPKEDRLVNLTTISFILKKVAHPTRLAIIYLLEKKGELSVNSMVEILDCEQSLLSHHLSELKEIGLLKTERRGQQVFYSVSDISLTHILHSMDDSRFAGVAEAAQPTDESNATIIGEVRPELQATTKKRKKTSAAKTYFVLKSSEND